jgi:hypothetical protein
VPSEECEQARERERGARGEPGPGDRASDRGDAVADRQSDEGEEAEETDGEKGADK